jgi:branched-chain amino acid transport system permease protein
MPGALLGGLLVGLSEALSGFMIMSSLKSLFSFALLIVVLLVRPQGLLGRRG